MQHFPSTHRWMSRLSSLLLILALLSAFAVPALAQDGASTYSRMIAPTVSTTIVISEFRTRGPNGATDEFVEIFNLSNTFVDISGWKINGSNNSGTTSTRVTIASSVTLGSGCRYLVTNSAAPGYSGSTPGNQTYTVGLTDDGGIALLDATNAIIDQVGMSTGSAYKEGTTLAPTTVTQNQSYERKPASVNTTDTDNNASDFLFNSGSSNPQNASSGCTPLAVTLAGFAVEPHADRIQVTWETLSEANNAGFNVYRADNAAGPQTLLAYVPSQAPGSTQGFAYSYDDLAVQSGQTYWYWLEDVSLSGATTLHGPVSATVSAPTAVTLTSLQATPLAPAIPAATAALAGLAGLMAAAGVAARRRRVR